MTRRKKSHLERRHTRVEKAKVKGALQGEAEFRRSKTGKKDTQREILESTIKTLAESVASDPARVAAIAGMTFIVKTTIDATEEFRGALAHIESVATGGTAVLAKLGFPPILRDVLGLPVGASISLAGLVKGEYPDVKGHEGFFPDWMDWLISFCIAYMLVVHGGAIIQAMGGFTQAIGMFLGVTAAA